VHRHSDRLQLFCVQKSHLLLTMIFFFLLKHFIELWYTYGRSHIYKLMSLEIKYTCKTITKIHIWKDPSLKKISYHPLYLLLLSVCGRAYVHMYKIRTLNTRPNLILILFNDAIKYCQLMVLFYTVVLYNLLILNKWNSVPYE
jgi:hypothetical protein